MIKTKLSMYLDRIRKDCIVDFHGILYYRCDITIPKDIDACAYVPKDKVDSGEIQDSEYYKTDDAYLTSMYPVRSGNHAFRCDCLTQSSEQEQEHYGQSTVTLNGRISRDITFNSLQIKAPSGDYMIQFDLFINNEFKQTFIVPAYAMHRTAEEISKLPNGVYISVRAKLANRRSGNKIIPNQHYVRILDFNVCE